MHATTKKYLPYLFLLILCIPLFFIGIIDVHSWGDDFSQYIREALNIAHGKPFYESNYVFNPYNPVYAPPQYPPGYPLLLAPVVKMWGISFKAMCYFNSFIVSCLLFSLYSYFRKYAGVTAALCLSVMICYSGFMIDLKRNVLADASCLLFITLYLTARKSDSFSYSRLALLSVFVSLAIMMRSQAIFLVAAEGIFLVVLSVKSVLQKTSASLLTSIRPSAFIICGALVLNLLVNKILFPTPLSTSGFYNNFIKDALNGHVVSIAVEFTGYLLKTVIGFFHYETYQTGYNYLMLLIDRSALVLCIVGFFLSIWKRTSVEDVFFVIMCVLIIYYPVRDPRYFLPAVPVLFYYFYFACVTLIPVKVKIPRYALALSFLLLYLCTGFGQLKKMATETPAGCIPQQKEIIAFDYLATHISDKDVIVFNKPRALTLFTDKKCMNVSWQMSPEMNKRVFDSVGVKYMLVIDGFEDGFFKDYLRNVQHPIDSARIADGYILYTLK